MIVRPTTLLLGAGASCTFGYPLGYQLRDQVCRHIRQQQKVVGDDGSLQELFLGMSRGGFSSPDAYLEQNPRFIPVGKRLIAEVLKRHEVEDLLFPPHNSGWFGYLFSRLATPHIDDFPKNRLSVVTFNYDRALECFLHRSVQHRYHLDDPTAWDVVRRSIPIVHLHGILGEYPDEPYNTGSSRIDEFAGKIKIIHELDESSGAFCAPEFETANRWLRESDAIVALGFGFGETNVRRLKCLNRATLDSKAFNAAIGNCFSRERDRLLAPLDLNPRTVHTVACENLFKNVCDL